MLIFVLVQTFKNIIVLFWLEHWAPSAQCLALPAEKLGSQTSIRMFSQKDKNKNRSFCLGSIKFEHLTKDFYNLLKSFWISTSFNNFNILIRLLSEWKKAPWPPGWLPQLWFSHGTYFALFLLHINGMQKSFPWKDCMARLAQGAA